MNSTSAMPSNYPSASDLVSEYPKTRIIVVVPTYNEAGNIEKITEEVLNQSLAVDLLIVDDNSPDGTGQIADTLAESPQSANRVYVLHRAAKEGLGRAYLAGFAWALAAGYDAVVEMDADLSHNPLYLQSIGDAAKSADVVIGSRYLNGISVINWPLSRILLSWGANWYVRTVTQLAVNDCTSGYRLYHRRVLEAINLGNVHSNGYSFQVEMTFRAQLCGFQITEVPIIFMERREGQSKLSKGVVLESFIMPLKLRWQARAMKREMEKVQQVQTA
ncbi:MAG: polyprenol monophosphomannose synthase [Janthinobacterium lividum]